MPELLTARLQLRPPRAEDFEGWARLMADPEAARFIGGVQPRAAAWRGFLTMVGAWQIRGFGMFSVIERASGQWIGRIGPWQPEGWPGSEVGWGLLSEWQGRGFAHEAAVASIGWAFDQLGWTEVIHAIDPANRPSQRLAERLGSRLRGPGRLPPPFEALPIEIWGQTRAQWCERHGA
ncbi:GNAT family N-acetyltransferase [Aquimonas voraii]|uniref:Protein N-acetyltransferase, RimJ/RimL family n=1 Tax=Aquimonas voraii TaxID=265719 RepID=A0A1G7AGF0_9GAMM|nr:GNAT family N-acetyltransferase [Aquimonas voraii]SDE13125.1 Protein N-acetyltransferase, RimJ/RimL family [Aquimonas voraii]